jgi:hypothetical protein
MDCDDISHRERLEKQIEFMEKNPEIAVCGSWVKTVGNNFSDIWKYPESHEEIHCNLLFNSCLAHPSVIIRNAVFRHLNLSYDPTFKRCEDYDLWVRLCENGQKLANIQEVLLLYRTNQKKNKNEQYQNAQKVRSGQIRSLGVLANSEEMSIHEFIACHNYLPSREFLYKSGAWLEKILIANENQKIYSSDILLTVIASRWLEIIQRSTVLGAFAWEAFSISPLSKATQIGAIFKIKFF